MKIDCYQIFCIYQQNRECLLDTIDISEAGLCRCCITVPLDETELELKKGQLRNLYLHMDEEWKRK